MRVAESLGGVADAGESEYLALALYEALAVAPFDVLPILSRRSGGTIESLCTLSFEAEIPEHGVRPYFQSIRAKLALASSPVQTTMAVECLRGLDVSQAVAEASGLE